nr:transposase [uncultured Ottowia sp.]
MNARIRALCDALGHLVKSALMPGQRHDGKGVQELIRNPKFGALLADKAFDVQWLIELLQAQGVSIVISQRPNRRRPLTIDGHRYRWPHLNRKLLWQAQGVQAPCAMRSDKSDVSFKAAIYLASAVI